MHHILVILPMVLGAVLGGTIMQPVDIPASSSGTAVGTQQVQYSTAANSPQGAVAVPPPRLYYPTYDEYEPAYSVQTGYETYVVPGTTSVEAPNSWSSGLWSIMSPVSRFALSYGARIGVYILNLMLLLVLGAIFTTSICSFTPLCTITILGLGKAEVKEQVSELARTYMTPERISAATSLVKRAIDKYVALQKQPDKEATEKPKEES